MWPLVVVLGLAAGLAVAVMRFRSPRTVVIGAQLAEAHARDRIHRARFGHLPSPLPQLRYDSFQGEMTLIDPQVSELDRQLRSLCARAAASSEEERRDFRNGASGDDFYTLLNFARRASVFALRDRDPTWIQDALIAVAAIDAARIDERDIPLTLSLIHHAAERLQLQPLQVFDTAAALAEPDTSRIIKSFVRRPTIDKDIQSSWGHQEIESSGGMGFVQRGFEIYEPTLDLLRPALAIREAIRRDRYEGNVTLATELPAVWFPQTAREKAADILAHSAAAASVNGSLRPAEHERADAQSLLVFIVETRSEHDAATLEALARISSPEAPATIAVHNGRLFALAVGRSFEVGVAPYETSMSIERFEGPLRAALQEAGG